MKRIILIFLVILVLIGCNKDELEISDNNLIEQNQEEPQTEVNADVCPASCDDGNVCTNDTCSLETGLKCENLEIVPCCGNEICEVGETYTTCQEDCPECISTAKCLNVSYDYVSKECKTENIVPCCGNEICENGETYTNCQEDCPECTTSKECFKSVYDYAIGSCVEKPEVPCCGNNICDKGESCDSCNSDCKCEAKIDLSNYPDFLSDGALIVVGDNSKSQDSFTASSITTALVIKGVNSISNLYSLHDSTALKTKDLIVVGNPCDNSLWEKYQGVECDENYFNSDEAMIKLIIVDGRQIVYIAGHSPEDTKKAAEFLNDEGPSGTEVILDTSGPVAEII